MTAPLLGATAPVANWQWTASENALGQPVGPPLPPGWAPPPRPVRRTLTGTSVSCVPLSADHAPELYAELSRAGDAHWTWLPYGPFASEEAFAAWAGASSLSADPLFFTLMVEGRAAGVASVCRSAAQTPGE